jgi:hypothetical protein
MKLSRKQMVKVEETLKDFKCLIPRYLECKSSPKKLKSFCTRNRNPLWDLTNLKYFSTGLRSTGSISIDPEVKTSKEHYIQRSLAMGLIFDELVNNPNMKSKEFLLLIKKYGSTVEVLREEHKSIGRITKNTGIFNFRIYKSVGIDIPGLDKYLTSQGIV